MKSYKVAIIGCGELGSRHLQAVASLSLVTEICVIDPNQEALELGKKRLAEIIDCNPKLKISWQRDLDNFAANGDLCIIATRAKERCVLVKKAASDYGYRKFLLEKVVSQSVEEYQELLDFCRNNKIKAWVNCKTRAYQIHQYIKDKIGASTPIIFTRVAGNHGLVSNGIHAADLFVFYDQCKEILPQTANIDNVVHLSKRQGVYDLSGTLVAQSDKRSVFIVSFAANHLSPDYITIVSSEGRFFIDQFQQLAMESYPGTDWVWRNIQFKENWLVSYMTKNFVQDILTQDNCALPSLEECFLAHKYILGELLGHFNRLLKLNSDFCPVT